jgi:hypothetical protein
MEQGSKRMKMKAKPRAMDGTRRTRKRLMRMTMMTIRVKVRRVEWVKEQTT